MTGASDLCFKEPQGPNERKMTTVICGSCHLWVTRMQTIASKIKGVHLRQHVCICM